MLQLPLTTVALLLVSISPANAGLSPFMRVRGNEQWEPARATATPPGFRPGVQWQKNEAEDGGNLAPVSPAPTRRPDLGAIELVKRFQMGSDTCGFAAEYKSAAWTCNKVSASCVSSGTNLGCCSGSGTGSAACSSTMANTCVDYTKDVTRSCGPGQLCCASASPSCFTWRFSSSTSSGKTYSAFNCYTTGGTGTLKDQPPQVTQPTSSGADKETTKPDLNPSSSVQTSTTSSTASTTTAAAASGDDGGSSTNNTGPIVGGVVGGVAVIALIGVAIFWMVVRNRRKREAAAAAPSMAASSPGMGQHNPHYSYGPPGQGPGQGQDPGYLASMHQYMNAEQKPPEHAGQYPAQHHYSAVPQEGAWPGHTPPQGYGQGLHPPPGSHRQSHSPTVVSELGAASSLGTQGNRAELGSGMGHS